MRRWRRPDLLEEEFCLGLVFQGRGAVRSSHFQDKFTGSSWGNLKPGSCKFSLKARSLNEAYALMQKLQLAPVYPDLRETYLASGSPFSHQVEGLVAKNSDEFYMREPWQVTVATSAGEQLTWALIETARLHLPPNLRDGQTVSREPLEGPLSSHQVAKEFSHHSVIGNIVKTRKRKKTTAAKRTQLQELKLFKVCMSKKGNEIMGGKQTQSGSLDQGALIESQLGQEECKKEKRRKKMTRKREKEEVRKRKKAEKENQQKVAQEVDVGVEAKRGNMKYRHLQAFVEKRRQKREVQKECSVEEKSPPGFNAEVFTHL